MRFKLLAGVLFGAIALTFSTSAQFRVDVALVDTVVTVTDSKGLFVPNLKAEDFIVDEDGIIQTVSHVGESFNEPMSVGILLDTSRSMETRIPNATSAIERFIRMVHQDDDIFLMTFSAKTAISQGFTGDRALLSQALRRIQLAPETILYDAVDDGLLHIERGQHRRRALLLVTDGQDSGDSSDSLREVVANLRHSGVMVYALGIEGDAPAESIGPPPGDQQSDQTLPMPGTGITLPGRNLAARQGTGGRAPAATQGRGAAPQRGGNQTAVRGALPAQARGIRVDRVNMDVLNALADASGGKAWLVAEGGRELSSIMDQIADELRSQYTVGYYPKHPIRDGVWHRVEIRTRNPAYTTRAKRDYFGG